MSTCHELQISEGSTFLSKRQWLHGRPCQSVYMNTTIPGLRAGPRPSGEDRGIKNHCQLKFVSLANLRFYGHVCVTFELNIKLSNKQIENGRSWFKDRGRPSRLR